MAAASSSTESKALAATFQRLCCVIDGVPASARSAMAGRGLPGFEEAGLKATLKAGIDASNAKVSRLAVHALEAFMSVVERDKLKIILPFGVKLLACSTYSRFAGAFAPVLCWWIRQVRSIGETPEGALLAPNVLDKVRGVLLHQEQFKPLSTSFQEVVSTSKWQEHRDSVVPGSEGKIRYLMAAINALSACSGQGRDSIFEVVQFCLAPSSKSADAAHHDIDADSDLCLWDAISPNPHALQVIVSTFGNPLVVAKVVCDGVGGIKNVDENAHKSMGKEGLTNNAPQSWTVTWSDGLKDTVATSLHIRRARPVGLMHRIVSSCHPDRDPKGDRIRTLTNAIEKASIRSEVNLFSELLDMIVARLPYSNATTEVPKLVATVIKRGIELSSEFVFTSLRFSIDNPRLWMDALASLPPLATSLRANLDSISQELCDRCSALIYSSMSETLPVEIGMSLRGVIVHQVLAESVAAADGRVKAGHAITTVDGIEANPDNIRWLLLGAIGAQRVVQFRALADSDSNPEVYQIEFELAPAELPDCAMVVCSRWLELLVKLAKERGYNCTLQTQPAGFWSTLLLRLSGEVVEDAKAACLPALLILSRHTTTDVIGEVVDMLGPALPDRYAVDRTNRCLELLQSVCNGPLRLRFHTSESAGDSCKAEQVELLGHLLKCDNRRWRDFAVRLLRDIEAQNPTVLCQTTAAQVVAAVMRWWLSSGQVEMPVDSPMLVLALVTRFPELGATVAEAIGVSDATHDLLHRIKLDKRWYLDLLRILDNQDGESIAEVLLSSLFQLTSGTSTVVVEESTLRFNLDVVAALARSEAGRPLFDRLLSGSRTMKSLMETLSTKYNRDCAPLLAHTLQFSEEERHVLLDNLGKVDVGAPSGIFRTQSLGVDRDVEFFSEIASHTDIKVKATPESFKRVISLLTPAWTVEPMSGEQPPQPQAGPVSSMEAVRALSNLLPSRQTSSSPDANIKLVLTPSTLINVAKICEVLHDPVPLLLEGPTGVGKSATVDAAAKINGQRLVRFNMSSRVTIQDFCGKVDLVYREETRTEDFVFTKQPFTEAFENGYWLLLDELNLAPDTVLQCIESALDTGVLIIYDSSSAEQHTLKIKRHQGFRLFATQNPNSGFFKGKREKLSASFLNRFRSFTFDQLPRDEWREIITKRLNQVGGALSEVGFCQQLADMMLDLHFNVQDSVFGKTEPFKERTPYSEISIRELLKWIEYVQLTAADPQKATVLASPDAAKPTMSMFGWLVYGARVRPAQSAVP